MCNNENTGSRQKNPVRNIDSSQKNVNRKDKIMIENQDFLSWQNTLILSDIIPADEDGVIGLYMGL